jgi:hypothetical protein
MIEPTTLGLCVLQWVSSIGPSEKCINGTRPLNRWHFFSWHINLLILCVSRFLNHAHKILSMVSKLCSIHLIPPSHYFFKIIIRNIAYMLHVVPSSLLSVSHPILYWRTTTAPTGCHFLTFSFPSHSCAALCGNSGTTVTMLRTRTVFPTLFARGTIGFRKITIDPHIFAHVNTVSGWQVSKIKDIC